MQFYYFDRPPGLLHKFFFVSLKISFRCWSSQYEPLINVHLFWILDWQLNVRIGSVDTVFFFKYTSVTFVLGREREKRRKKMGERCSMLRNDSAVYFIWFVISKLIQVGRMNSTFGVWLLCCADLNKLTVIEFNLTSAICYRYSAVANSNSSYMSSGCEFCLYIYWLFFFCFFSVQNVCVYAVCSQ